MKTTLKRPCSECPFRKIHMPGWLGPWKAQDIVNFVHRDGGLACHRTVRKDGKDTEGVQACAGAAIHMNKSVKCSKHKDMRELQDKMETAPADVIDGIIKWPHDFIAHHEQTPKQWMAKKRKQKETT